MKKAASATLFKIVMRWDYHKTTKNSRIKTTRLYQSKKTFDRSWDYPPYSYLSGAHYDAYELRKGKWAHIAHKIAPE